MVAPEVRKVARETAGRLLVAKVNTEEVPSLGRRFRVSAIPTMTLFETGLEVARHQRCPRRRFENLSNKHKLATSLNRSAGKNNSNVNAAIWSADPCAGAGHMAHGRESSQPRD